MPQLLKLNPNLCPIPTKAGVKFDRIQLFPGINNQLTEEQVAKVLQHPDATAYLDSRGIEIVDVAGEPVKVEVEPTSIDLKALPTTKTDDVINATNDLPTLERWLQEENRITVRKQLTQRIEFIKEGK